jgi:hypothetical protein
LSTTFLLRLVTLICASCFALSFATFIEGSAPQLTRIVVGSLNTAGLGAAAWTLGEWKKNGGVIALASGGRSPILVAIYFCVLVSIVSTGRYWVNEPASNGVTFEPGIIMADYPDRTVFSWHDGRVISEYRGEVRTGPVMVAPQTRSVTNRDTYLWWTVVLQVIICSSLIGWLVLSTMRSNGTVLASTALAAGLCEFFARLTSSM